MARVWAIFGPTAIGKTAVAMALAERLRARGEDPVAVSADALQVYAGLEILTGAATSSERAALEHRLVGFLAPQSEFSVGEYMPLAHAEIDEALEAGRAPIVVGGTGLYLRAALTQLDLRPPPPRHLRAELEQEVAGGGSPAAHARLTQQAPALAARIDPGDRSRVVRALELVEMEAVGEADALSPSQLWTADSRHPTVLVGLVMEREALYRRIERRVDEMVAAGAERQVRELAAEGASRTARAALGFEELLAGDVQAMKQRTRRYAKRQLTWMRKLAGATVLDVTGRGPEDVAAEILRLGDDSV